MRTPQGYLAGDFRCKDDKVGEKTPGIDPHVTGTMLSMAVGSSAFPLNARAVWRGWILHLPYSEWRARSDRKGHPEVAGVAS
jgi:hypothetical protein